MPTSSPIEQRDLEPTSGYRTTRLRSANARRRRFDGLDAEGRPVAIEVRTDRLELAARARALMGLAMPGLAPIRRVGIEGESWFVVTDASGPSLEELAPREPLPPDEVVALLDPLASALDRLHAAGATHTTFCPENVVLAAGAPALWIVGAPTGPLLREAGGGQTASIEAPEGLDYVPPDVLDRPTRPDVYALGVLAFRLLSGSLPFRRFETLTQALVERMRPAPRIAERARQPVRPAVEEWARAALASDPSLRPSSAEALVRSLALAAGVAIGDHAAAVARLAAGPEGADARATSLAMPVVRRAERDITVQVPIDRGEPEEAESSSVSGTRRVVPLPSSDAPVESAPAASSAEARAVAPDEAPLASHRRYPRLLAAAVALALAAAGVLAAAALLH